MLTHFAQILTHLRFDNDVHIIIQNVQIRAYPERGPQNVRNNHTISGEFRAETPPPLLAPGHGLRPRGAHANHCEPDVGLMWGSPEKPGRLLAARLG